MTIALTEKGEWMMATCEDCVHYECCSTFESLAIRIILCGENADKRCGIFKNKADFNKTIDDLITEIHCLEAKCRKYEEEIARLKSIIKEMSEENI